VWGRGGGPGEGKKAAYDSRSGKEKITLAGDYTQKNLTKNCDPGDKKSKQKWTLRREVLILTGNDFGEKEIAIAATSEWGRKRETQQKKWR